MATPKKSCSVSDCNNATLARGLCRKHYQRWQKHGDPERTDRTQNGEPAAFIDKVLEYRGGDCLFWPYERSSKGYPIVQFEGRKVYAHRVVCERINGVAPSENDDAAHSCGRGHLGCITPKHLRWASRLDNMADRVTHGTVPRGRRNGSNKLTEDNVRSIRALRGQMSQHQIAELFGVGHTIVSDIQLRKKWAWLQ